MYYELKVEEWDQKTSLHYSYEVPSVYFILGAGTKARKSIIMVNQCIMKKLVFNEDILVTGAAMHAYSAIMWLKNNSTNYKIDYTINEI